MILPGSEYILTRMAQFTSDAAKILPPGFEPMVYEPSGEYHWFRIKANNNKGPEWRIYAHRPDLSDMWTVVHGAVHCMPGCCGACVITSISVAPRFQRKGLGTLMGKLLLDMGQRYSQAIATILPSTDANVWPMHKLATKLGFEVYPQSQFKNRNTDNQVVTCSRLLPA